jgi:hypothetical protein
MHQQRSSTAFMALSLLLSTATASVSLLIGNTHSTICGITLNGAKALAQSSEPAPRPKRRQDPDSYYHAPTSIHGKTIVLPIGTTFEGRIDQTISSEHSHPGTRFRLVVDSPVLVNGSDVVIPSGSEITGEVVEATRADDVPHQKWQDKRLVHGKLRVQINGLRTPEGNTYPLVAQLQGDVPDKMHAQMNTNRLPLGTSVGYVGTAAGFEAANANRTNYDMMRQQRIGAPQVMSKKDFMKDEVLGNGIERTQPDFSHIRSLVLKKRDYYIYNGSPLTVKVMAPFKIGISNPGQGVNVGSVGDEPRDTQLPPPSVRVDGGGNDFAAQGGSGGGSGTQSFPAPTPTRETNPNNDSF